MAQEEKNILNLKRKGDNEKCRGEAARGSRNEKKESAIFEEAVTAGGTESRSPPPPPLSIPMVSALVYQHVTNGRLANLCLMHSALQS